MIEFIEKDRNSLVPDFLFMITEIRKMFPRLSWKLAAAWTGTFGQSDDGLPYIGAHKHFPGAQFALGYGGNGITFAAIASRIIPDLILGTRTLMRRFLDLGGNRSEWVSFEQPGLTQNCRTDLSSLLSALVGMKFWQVDAIVRRRDTSNSLELFSSRIENGL
jgi:hypothetical protein